MKIYFVYDQLAANIKLLSASIARSRLNLNVHNVQSLQHENRIIEVFVRDDGEDEAKTN